MVHGFKIENDKLILDVEEILQYPLLQQIYARDDININTAFKAIEPAAIQPFLRFFFRSIKYLS